MSTTSSDDDTANQVATELAADYNDAGAMIVKAALVTILGMALCIFVTGIIVAVALGYRGSSRHTSR